MSNTSDIRSVHHDELFRIVVEGAKDFAILTIDPSGRIATWNPAAEAMIGYREEEAVGMPAATLFTPEDRAEGVPAAEVRWATSAGKAMDERWHMRKNGERFFASGVLTPLRNDAGAIIGFVKILRDLTEQKRAESGARFLSEANKVLSSSLDLEETMRALVDLAVPSLAEGALLHILEAEGRVRRVAGKTADPEVLLRFDEMLALHPDTSAVRHGYPQVLRTGEAELLAEVTPAVLEAITREDRTRGLLEALRLRSALCVPLRAGGRTIGALTLATFEGGRVLDESDLAVAEELALRAAVAVENARLYAQAMAASRSKDEFIATISHELRTPLNAIVGWANLLRDGNLDPATTRRAVDTIVRNASAQATLINDLLDVGRIVSGQLHLEVQELDLIPVIEGALESVRLSARAKDITLARSLDPEAQTILGDPTRMQQVVWNLLANAVKFTPRGGRIEVRLEPAEDYLRLVVADNGQGIAPEALPGVFDRYRHPSTRSPGRSGGLGLGLAIVRHLVELHGGTVEAESDGNGNGARFIVTLPAWNPRAIEARAEERAGTPPAQTLRGATVLLVEDDNDTRELVATMLERLGAEVHAAASAAEAIESFGRRLPDVLVSDIQMPEGDGYELIRRIRSLPPERGGAVPAIALTGMARREDHRRAIEAGYQIHLPKPVTPARLAAVLTFLLRPRP